MRAAASLALLAVATRSTHAIFCFVKEQKCLPGVELSVDYDEIPELLGLSKSSTLTGTATSTTSASTLQATESGPTSFAVPTSVGPDFLNGLVPHPRINATPPGLPEAAASPTTVGPGFLGDLFPRGNEDAPRAFEYGSHATLLQSVETPVETRVMPPSYNSPPETTQSPFRPQHTEHALPSYGGPEHVTRPLSVPAAHHTYALPVASLNTESPRLPPSYQAPKLPVPDSNVELPRFNLTATAVHSSASRPRVYATPSSHSRLAISSEINRNVSATTIPTKYHETHPQVYPTKHTSVPLYHSLVSSMPHKSKITALSTEVPDTTIDVTTTVTEWITVTPTHTVVLPKPTSPEKESPKPSAPKEETPEVVSLTKTVNVWVPPTWLSFATPAVPYTANEKPTSSCSPGHHSTGMYPMSSNATTIQSATYTAPHPTAPKATAPTIYVTPIPAAQSSWAWTQDPTKPDEPETYTGAASRESLSVLFVAAAGIGAVMILWAD